jgi:hypothetical protein
MAARKGKHVGRVRTRERYKSEHHTEKNLLRRMQKYANENPNDKLVGAKIEELKNKLSSYIVSPTVSKAPSLRPRR